MMTLLRGLLFENLGLKLVALLLAVLVYLNVYTDRPADMVISFPLHVEDLPDSLAIAGGVPAAVQAELRGTGKQLLRLRLAEPPVKVSLAGVGAGRFQRAIQAEDLPLGAPSEGARLERLIGPRTLDLTIEHRAKRHVPVAVRIEGAPAAGFAWSGRAEADPALVEVSGPRSVVLHLDSLRLSPVAIAGRRDTVSAPTGPANLPEGCVVDPPVVRVTVPIRRGE